MKQNEENTKINNLPAYSKVKTQVNITSCNELFSKLNNYHFSTFNLQLYFSNRDAKDCLVEKKILNFHLKKIKTTAINLFGGLTTQVAEGFYKSSKGQIIRENISILNIYGFDETSEFKKVKYLLKLFLDYGKHSGQEALLLSIDNTITLINL